MDMTFIGGMHNKFLFWRSGDGNIPVYASDDGNTWKLLFTSPQQSSPQNLITKPNSKMTFMSFYNAVYTSTDLKTWKIVFSLPGRLPRSNGNAVALAYCELYDAFFFSTGTDLYLSNSLGENWQKVFSVESQVGNQKWTAIGVSAGHVVLGGEMGVLRWGALPAKKPLQLHLAGEQSTYEDFSFVFAYNDTFYAGTPSNLWKSETGTVWTKHNAISFNDSAAAVKYPCYPLVAGDMIAISCVMSKVIVASFDGAAAWEVIWKYDESSFYGYPSTLSFNGTGLFTQFSIYNASFILYGGKKWSRLDMDEMACTSGWT
eukprot:TRINITY_DN2647_c0_g1_i1.p1 TRINITY_DN2647_c0_g1~~TRINITY_DN2647_c0_g1_i1.p1  ORF type:complete len:342 (-),score=37.63 TRINITY_DN2647_c0_g1_i1:1098-2045(-)